MNKLPGIALCVTLLWSGIVAADPVPVDLTLVRTFGPPGYRVEATSDFDGDGRAELLVTRPGSNAVDLIESADLPRGYAVRHRFDQIGPMGAPLVVRALDVDGDGDMEIAILRNGGPAILTVYDGRTLHERARGPIIGASDFDVGDVDGDGEPELIAGSGGSIHLYDRDTLAPEGHAWAPVSIRSLRVADVTGDGTAEVVTNGAAIGLARTPELVATVVWTHPEGEMDWFTPVDVDGDGKMEVAGGGLYTDLVLHRIHPVQDTSVLRQILPDLQLTHVVFEDVDADGRIDAVLSINDRVIEAIDLVAGVVHWSIERSHPGEPAVTVASMQGNGQLQVVYLEGEVLRVENVGPEAAPLWTTFASGPPVDVTSFNTPGGRCDMAALAGNPSGGPALPETYAGKSLSGGAAAAASWLPALTWPDYYHQVAILPALDPTRPDEVLIVAGSERSHSTPEASPKLWFIGADTTLKRTVEIGASLVPQAAVTVDAADIPGLDVFVMGHDPALVGGSRVIAVDADSGAVTWQSDTMPTDEAGLWKLAALDLEADGSTEIVLCCGVAGEAIVYRPADGTAPVRTYPDVWDAAVHAPRSGSAGLVLLRDGGALQLFDADSAVPAREIQIGNVHAAIAATTLYPSEEPLVAAASGSSLRIYSFDAAEPVLSAPAGSVTQVKAIDAGCDNQPELVLFGGDAGVYRLGNDHVYTDGFEPPVR